MIKQKQLDHLAFQCGPLQLSVFSDSMPLIEKTYETLVLYNVQWPDIGKYITVFLYDDLRITQSLSGTYLLTRRMLVDRTSTGLAAACESGATAAYEETDETWHLHIPSPAGRGLEDIEDLLGLILTTGWRRLGLVPLHAGGVIHNKSCAILCAPSGGGKSTLTTALLSRGWGTLGDDKLLLAYEENSDPILSSLLLNFNLHPHTEEWFPEVGDLQRLPPYSYWTPKRRVNINAIWPTNGRLQAKPTHLVLLIRQAEDSGFHLQRIDKMELLPLLLQQTVIPKDAQQAKQILATVAKTANQLQGWALHIGEDAYRDPNQLEILEKVLG